LFDYILSISVMTLFVVFGVIIFWAAQYYYDTILKPWLDR